MSEETKIDPNHEGVRPVLRTLGPIIFGLGLLLTVIGIGNFFWSFGGFEPPRYFWCAFLGLPLMFVGSNLSMHGFLGAYARYVAGEAAPVQKDVFNYMAHGTREGVKTLAQAVGEGLAAAHPTRQCARCQQGNDSDARFCKHCGTALV